MLYFLFEYLELKYQLPGASLFQYISFSLFVLQINSQNLEKILFLLQNRDPELSIEILNV